MLFFYFLQFLLTGISEEKMLYTVVISWGQLQSKRAPPNKAALTTDELQDWGIKSLEGLKKFTEGALGGSFS